MFRHPSVDFIVDLDSFFNCRLEEKIMPNVIVSDMCCIIITLDYF